MNKYIINFSIGLGITALLTLFLILFVTYPLVGYIIILPFFLWACYYIGTVVKEIWQDRTIRKNG